MGCNHGNTGGGGLPSLIRIVGDILKGKIENKDNMAQNDIETDFAFLVNRLKRNSFTDLPAKLVFVGGSSGI